MTLTGLTRTDLSVREKAHLAASAYAKQDEFGSKTQLAGDFGVSRPTVYSAADSASKILEAHFEQAERGDVPVTVAVDRAQLCRAIVALRAVAPNSLRAIETVMPILYPGVTASYACVQAVACEAERNAAAYNAECPLDSIQCGALDEMFSQGDPVLAGIDLDTGFVFGLELTESRSGADWERFLERAKQQGLALRLVVKDAGRGIAAGVTAVYPDAQQRDDCFHALYEMNKVRIRLERRGYAAIAQELEAERERERSRWNRKGSRGERAQKGQLLGRQRARTARALELHDAFESAMRDAQDAMEFADSVTGALRTPEEMQARLEAAGQRMRELDDKHCKRVGRYIINRAPGLASHMADVCAHMQDLAVVYDHNAVRLACLAYRNACDLRDGKRPWASSQQKQRLRTAIRDLEMHRPEDGDLLFAEVDIILQHRHRASSAIEGFNAALRPFLYVHKGVTQGFLELFRAYFNLRTRRWGRHKGTAPYELVTGHCAGDWLTRLGFPPSSTSLH